MNLKLRRRKYVLLGVASACALAVAGVALAANASSTFTFKFSPATVPKTTFKPGSLMVNLDTHYANPGNSVPGGATERTQIFLDKNFKINPNATPKCSPTKLAGKTMAQAMKACGNARVGNGTATANANGQFIIKGCVLLFNGPTQSGNPSLNVFVRIRVANPSVISCGDPAHNNQGNGTVLLKGVLKPAAAPYGKVLDVNHITQSASFPLEVFKTTIKKGNYVSAKCAAADKTWRMKTTWTYNNNTKKTVSKTQPCTVG